MSSAAIQYAYKNQDKSLKEENHHPVWYWLLAQLFALWPNWVWISRRMVDGSDDPLGLMAFGVLGILIWQHRHALRPAPQLLYLCTGLALTLLLAILQNHFPALLCNLIAMLAVACSIIAFLPRHVAKMPVILLAILALPILSSLQFYAGYPLRVITAEVSRWLLMLFYDVQRDGCTLMVQGQLIMVDAPCSGVQMAWLGYFCACTVALWRQLSNTQFLLRLPFVGMLILLGNILRNSALVILQVSQQQVPNWLHEGVGIVFLALVCLGILVLIGSVKPIKNHTTQTTEHTKETIHTLFYSKQFYKPCLTVFMMCALWGAYDAWAKPVATEKHSAFVEWPHMWEGKMLRPLALSEVERRFSNQFPGSIARMTDGKRMFIFRHVTKPTRKLHPAVDCYKGLGYQISQIQLERNAQSQELWRCFLATRGGQTLRVCEQIKDAHGQSYTDTSAWYWDAILNPDTGPWQTVTIAEVVL